MKQNTCTEPTELEGGSSASTPASAPAVQRRAFLAEDDGELRALLTGALEREGFAVQAVRDGLELVELVSSAPKLPELIVSDVQMPRLTGLAALAELRRRGVETPALLITAFGDDETHAAAMRLGAVIIDKPFDIYKFRTLAAVLVA
ncbi:response regulator [Myxococcota bacterium]|nr:response regulator [Myxococcota bacterium]